MNNNLNKEKNIENRKPKPNYGQHLLVVPALLMPVGRKPYRWSDIRWGLILWSLFGIMMLLFVLIAAWAIFLSVPQPAPQILLKYNQSQETSPTKPIPSVTPGAMVETFSDTGDLTFLEPTATWTTVPGGHVLVLTPQPSDVGWVASNDKSVMTIYDPPNHFGDSFLYTGTLDREIFHGAFQFDLSRVPRGTKINGASLHLTGRRLVSLTGEESGEWRLQLLGPEVDQNWQTLNYEQIHHATILVTLAPVLTPAQLKEGQTNQFEFTASQLAILEQHLLEGGDQFGQKISFRLDGPTLDSDNLFAWDSGYGPASRGVGPELILNLGSPPHETPLPQFVIITSTPTPENIMTAAAVSLHLTAESTRVGTATSLPRTWVTPFVVTVTPTPGNPATAERMSRLATAQAVMTGQPANMVTATSTPTYMIITSTPTPQEIRTAVAISLLQTADAARFGTPTPLPQNWVTPFVVTSTPLPESTATVNYWQAMALTTGTPTLMPANMQTATPTPIFVTVEPRLSPTPVDTPSPTPQSIPAILVDKIVFLSDREGATQEERLRAGLAKVTPQVTPQPYMYDPETGQLGHLTDIWPYEVAATREAWSADKRYETYNQELLWSTDVAIHYYDHLYNVERLVTRMGAGIVYDPVWSPVSNEIAFVATESGNDEIWVINYDGINVHQLTRNSWEWDKHPSWSPDGQQIVFYSNRTGKSQLWIMNKDGSGQRLLLDLNPYNDWDPVWIKYPEPAPPLVRQPDWRFLKPPEESPGTK